MWGEVEQAVESGGKAYLAVDLAFRKSGVAVVLWPDRVCWSTTIRARPVSPKKVTGWVIQRRVRSLCEQVDELHLEGLVPLLSGVFAETPEQFQAAMARRRKGSSYAAQVATGMAKAWLIMMLQKAGYAEEIVFVDPGKIDKFLTLGGDLGLGMLRNRFGDELVDGPVSKLNKNKLRRRLSVWVLTDDDFWWDNDGKKLIRSDDESDAAALGIVAARLDVLGKVDELRVSWRR